MELRKRTRTATAKATENRQIDAVASTPRKTRKTRRPASTSSPGGENDSQQGSQQESQQGGQAETSMDLSKSAGVEALGGLDGTEPIKSELGVDGGSSQKDEANGADKVVEHDTVEGMHDDGNTSKKRRKVITTASQEIESQDTVSESVNNVGMETHESKVSTEADDETKVDTHEGENRASDSHDSRSLEEASSGELRSKFMPGVELPIQPHKRKDVHTGPGIGTEPETSLNEATAKRPRRSSDEETIVEDTSSIKGSPAKRGRKKKNNGPPSRSEVEVPEIPTPPTRKRGRPRITYKEESDEDENEPAYLPPKASPRRNNKKGNIEAGTNNEVVEQAAPKGRKGRRNIWDKEVLLTSKKSRLATAADLSDVLNTITWGLLTPEEQKECLALLPSIDKVYAPPEPPSPSADPNGEALLVPDFFESNQVFKDSLVEFQDDLSQGRYESSYIKDAANARKARLEGVVDKYKDGLYELYWGQRQHNGMVAGAAAIIKLPELIQKGLLKAGDVWAYKRTIAGSATIEKEVKVVKVSEISINKADEKKKLACLVFHIPPGKHKFSHPSRADIVLEGVVAPSAVENVILSTHPDTPAHIPNGNAFKVFNIWRKGEDLGLLWEIRQTYWGGE